MSEIPRLGKEKEQISSKLTFREPETIVGYFFKTAY